MTGETWLVGCAVRTFNLAGASSGPYKLHRFNRAPPLPVGWECGGRGAGGEASGRGAPSTYFPSFAPPFPSPTVPSFTIAASVITTKGRGSTVSVPLPSWRTTCTVPMP